MFTEKTATWVLLFASCLTGLATAADVSTVRLMSDDGKPEKIVASAFSPDGRLFVVSVPARGITRSGYVAIIDLKGRRLVQQFNTMSFAALAFDNDSRHVLGVGGFAGVQQVNIESGKSRQMGESPRVVISSAPPETRVPIDWTESNGSLFVRSIRDKAIADQVLVGDQLVAFNEGETAIHHDASDEWQVLKPYGSKYVLKELDGLANSWLQLRFARQGKEDPIEITVQRKSSSRHARTESGNGKAGGDFEYRLNVLPGDVDQSGSVSVREVVALRTGLGMFVGDYDYNIMADLNASGTLAINDLGPIRMNLGRRLPDDNPSATPAHVFSIPAREVDAAMSQSAHSATDREISTFGSEKSMRPHSERYDRFVNTGRQLGPMFGNVESVIQGLAANGGFYRT